MKATFITLLVILGIGILISSSIPSCQASPDEVQQTPSDKPPGFFESHPTLVEFIAFPAFLLMWAAAMASPVATQTIKSDYWSWPDNRPIGSSYTNFQVPKEPATDEEIFKWLAVITGGYILLRFTCLISILPVIYQFVGAFIDVASGH